jgi:hypothetical protein
VLTFHRQYASIPFVNIAIPFFYPKQSAESVARLDDRAFQKLQNEIFESKEVKLAVAVCACVTAIALKIPASIPIADDE